jgi:hypothetical protein
VRAFDVLTYVFGEDAFDGVAVVEERPCVARVGVAFGGLQRAHPGDAFSGGGVAVEGRGLAGELFLHARFEIGGLGGFFRSVAVEVGERGLGLDDFAQGGLGVGVEGDRAAYDVREAFGEVRAAELSC